MGAGNRPQGTKTKAAKRRGVGVRGEPAVRCGHAQGVLWSVRACGERSRRRTLEYRHIRKRPCARGKVEKRTTPAAAEKIGRRRASGRAGEPGPEGRDHDGAGRTARDGGEKFKERLKISGGRGPSARRRFPEADGFRRSGTFLRAPAFRGLFIGRSLPGALCRAFCPVGKTKPGGQSRGDGSARRASRFQAFRISGWFRGALAAVPSFLVFFMAVSFPPVGVPSDAASAAVPCRTA